MTNILAVPRGFRVLLSRAGVPAPWWRSVVGSGLGCGASRWFVRGSARAWSGAVVVVAFPSSVPAYEFARRWAACVRFPVAVRPLPGGLWGASVPVCVPAGYPLAPPPSAVARFVAWVR